MPHNLGKRLFPNTSPSNAGIIITSIVQPATGAVMLLHCPECRKTEIVVNEYAVKPERGDYWLVRGTCLEFPMHAIVYEKRMFPLYGEGDGERTDRNWWP